MLLAWAVQSSHAHDCLDSVFPLDEAIIEAMLRVEPPWEELHHRSYFLPELDRLEREDFGEVLSERIGSPMVPLSSPSLMDDGNMANISPTIPINISRDPGRIENVYIGENVPMLRFKNTLSYLKNFVMSLLGLTTKFQVSTLVLSSTRLRLIPMPSLFNNSCVR